MEKTKGVTIVELIVVISIVLFMIAVLTPFVQMAKGRTNKITCAENLMRISLGLHTYAREHNGEFPPDIGTLYPDYIQDPNTFDCPATKKRGTSRDAEYKYISGLTVKSSPKEIVAEDADGNHGRAGRNILRVDGSVEWAKKGQ